MARMVYKKGGCLAFQMHKRDSNLKLTRKMMGTMQRRQMQTRKQEQVLWWFFEGAFQCNFNFSFVPKVAEGNLNLIYRLWGVQLRL